jgi:hypothetical protein
MFTIDKRGAFYGFVILLLLFTNLVLFADIFEQTNKLMKQEAYDASEGLFCGGIAGFLCPEGYTCKLDGSYPDAGGVCVKK